MRRRVAVLKSGNSESWVLAQGHQKPYTGAPISTPESSGLNVATSVADEHPHRITPIPISPISQPSEIFQRFRERDAR